MRKGGLAATRLRRENLAVTERTARWEGMIDLGGVSQFVAFRGLGAGKPVMLVLHGGPGDPAVAQFDQFCPVLADDFVVVHWDQRGSGRSYGRSIDPATMTLPQIEADAVEICEWLQERFGVDRVVIVGHSWGTYLGLRLAHARPDLVSVFVGVGQVVDQAESELRGWSWVRDEAVRRQHRRALAAIEACGPPVDGTYSGGLRGMLTQRRWVREFGGAAAGRGNRSTLWLLARPLLFTRVYRVRDKVAYLRGESFSMRHLEHTLFEHPPRTTMRSFEVPIVMIQGVDDRQTDTRLVVDYVHEIDAPHIQLELVEGAAHLVPFEQPRTFETLMRSAVLPHAR